MLNLAHTEAVKRLYAVKPCFDELYKAVIAHYTSLYPECGVTSCYSFDEGVQIGNITTICPPASAQADQTDCQPILVNRL